MKKQIRLLITAIIVCSITSNAQTSEWTTYTPLNSGLPFYTVRNVKIDSSGNKWMINEKAIVRFDGTNWTVFNNTNGLPDSVFWDIEIDKAQNIWVSTENNGLAKYSGGTWTVYNTSNSGILDYRPNQLAIDTAGNLWINFYYDEELQKFDGTNWTTYPGAPSGTFLNTISFIIDNNDVKWLGTNNTSGLLVKFDGASYTLYNSTNSCINQAPYGLASENNVLWLGGGSSFPLTKWDGTSCTSYNFDNGGIPYSTVSDIKIDNAGNKWLGHFGAGLTKFNGTTSTRWDLANSSIPSNEIYSIAIDNAGNKWIGSEGGLSMFKEGGTAIEAITKEQVSIYPNPATDNLFISSSSLNNLTVTLSDLTGKLIKQETLSNKQVSLSQISKGLYILQIESEQGFTIRRERIIIQ